MDEQEAHNTIVATLSRLGVTETDLGSARSTILRRRSARETQPKLPALVVSRAAQDDTADLRVHTLVGRGGMGFVHAAAQASLHRDVAVKTVARDDAHAHDALIREAQTVGALEHPNIVPVHALGVDEKGAPVLVMKLINGVTWRTLLGDRGHPLWSALSAGHGDKMRVMVEILMQVVRAVELAHSRGVVHRDLKPDNVMIGSFGEVYLVDWGIALRLDERHLEPDGIVGTPAYLAPEMARGSARDVDERTDVYLLGAILFELATGNPPHHAEAPMAALMSALMEVEIPPGFPQDMTELMRSSLSVDPMKRPQSAAAFRIALARHLAFHDADRLVQSADALVARAEKLFADEGADSHEAARALIEARFAFRSVLDTYDDTTIRERHDACVRRLVERELTVGNAAAASALARELVVPDAALQAKISAA